MHLQFLGTGAGLPAKECNVSAIALNMLAERGEIWLFDCGEATQHTILNTPIRLNKISKIFITHLHGDHIFGLLGLLCSRSMQMGATPMSLYGPIGLRQFVETGLNLSGSYLSYPLNIIELNETGTKNFSNTWNIYSNFFYGNILFQVFAQAQTGLLNV